MDYVTDNDVPVARTRRWERDRGFTRGCFVVVPAWEYVPAWATSDEAIALRLDIEQEAEDDAIDLVMIDARARATF